MKIRDKLSIQFTILVASILLVFCIAIYYWSIKHLRADFYNQLYDRTVTTAYIYLEKDGFPSDLYETFREQYTRTLPEEIAQMFDMQNQPAFISPSENITYDNHTINYIRDNYVYPEYYEFRRGDVQSVGLFYPDNQGDFVVIVSAIDIIGQSHLNNLALILVTGFSMSLVVLFFTGRIFAIQALKPIPEIVEQVNKISASNLHIRLGQQEDDHEISELVATFNKLLNRLEENFKLQQRFVANASHELRTPLTSIIGEIEVTLTKVRTSSEYQEVLNSIHRDALTLHELTSRLLEMARAENEKLSQFVVPVRIDELVIEASMQVEKSYKNSKINVNYVIENGQEENFYVQANRSLLLNAVINVIDNAVKFSPESSSVDVAIASLDERIEIRIEDRGIGIHQSELDKIYDPFYRTNEFISQNGYGIGLSLVKRILGSMDADIEIISKPGVGSVAILSFKNTDERYNGIINTEFV